MMLHSKKRQVVTGRKPHLISICRRLSRLGHKLACYYGHRIIAFSTTKKRTLTENRKAPEKRSPRPSEASALVMRRLFSAIFFSSANYECLAGFFSDARNNSVCVHKESLCNLPTPPMLMLMVASTARSHHALA